MNQDIENIIKNLPKYKNGSKAIPKDDIVVQYSALSLIADEVLRVVVETYREAIEFAIDTVNEEGNYCIRPGAKEGILKLVDYKLYLSPNKENENNEVDYSNK